MAKFPEPPDLSKVDAQTAVLEAEVLIWRIYFTGGAHPTAWNDFRHYGPTTARFDHHELPRRDQARGILYGATGPKQARPVWTCLAEIFQTGRTIERSRNAPWLVVFALKRPLTLLDLTGVWPTAAGASMAINSGPRPRARRWSQRIYDTYTNVDGLLYASSMHKNAPAVALYERAYDAVPDDPEFNRALADPSLLWRLNAAADALNFDLA